MNFILPSYKTLKNLEYFFLAVMTLSMAYIGYFFLVSNKNTDHGIVSVPAVAPSKINVDEKASLDLKSYDFYAQNVNSRDIFVSSGTSIDGGADPSKTAVPAGQLPPNFKVVGFDLGVHSQVIIEDSSTHQTYFIEQGKKQAGIGIESVTKDKVFLSYQGQTIQINLKGNQVYGSKTTP